MTNNFGPIINELYLELKKDILFFGANGFLVGVLMILNYRLKNIGIEPQESIAAGLFNDFISFNIFGFMFLSMIGLGSLLNCIKSLGVQTKTVEGVVQHVSTRFLQLTSSMLAFLLGVSALIFIHYLSTFKIESIIILLIIVIFSMLLATFFVLAIYICKCFVPFNRLIISSTTLIVSIIAIVSLIFLGSK